MKLTIHLLLLIVTLLIAVIAIQPAGIVSARSASSHKKSCNEGKLFDALNQIRVKRYDRGRTLLNKLVTPRCSLKAVASLLIADSYFREGDHYKISKAQSEYTGWLNSFPDHKLTPFVMRKVAETHLKLFNFNTLNHVSEAYRMLIKLQDQHPKFKDDPLVQEYFMLAQELMADNELSVGKFYFDHRRSMEAARLRCLEIINKYPQYTKFDTALWISAQVEEMEENRDKAIEYCQRIAREYPESEYREGAIEKLRSLGGSVPEPDLEAGARLRERTSRLTNILSDKVAYSKNISTRGVLLDENDEIEDYSLIHGLQK